MRKGRPNLSGSFVCSRIKPLEQTPSRRFLDEQSKVAAQFVSHAPKSLESFCFGVLDTGGILEAAVETSGVAGENRTTLFRVIANGKYDVEVLALEFVHELR